MKVVVRKVSEVKEKKDNAGISNFYVSVLLDFLDNKTAEWRVVMDDVFSDLNEIRVGDEFDMLCNDKKWVTVFDKLNGAASRKLQGAEQKA